MKKLIILIIAIVMYDFASAQEGTNSLEKEVVSVDIGFLGGWLNYERRLNNQFTINSQLGLEGGFFGGSGDFNYAFTPTISVGPRYYYNFNKRVSKGKKTINNSANYLTVSGTYLPDLFTVSNEESVEFEPMFTVIPKWGLRRAIGNHVEFEFAVGYGVYFSENSSGGQLGLDLKFGYVF